MIRALCRLTFVVLSFSTSLVAYAQPALERAEQIVRDQTRDNNPPAANAPAVPMVEPGYLGITADDRPDQGRGVRVVEIVPDSPAAVGGLAIGDLITAVNGQPIRLMDDMGRNMSRLPEGTKLTMSVTRQGRTQDHEITLGKRPVSRPFGRLAEEMPAPATNTAIASPVKLGVRTLLPNEESVRTNNLGDARGAQVVSVTPGSPAAAAEIPVGAVIVGLNGRPIQSPHELTEAVKNLASPQFELIYLDRGRQFHKRVSLGGEVPSNPLTLETRARVPQPPMPEDAATVGLSPAEAQRAHALSLEARVRQLEERLERLEASLTAPQQ